jgi:flagellin
MENSINTNVGAYLALQNLTTTALELTSTQNRISTGRKVNTAVDNGSTWAIAQNLRGQSTSLNAVRNSLDRAQSTVDVALSAGGNVSDLLIQMKEKVLAASDQSLDTTSRSALAEDFKVLREAIKKTVANADFVGTNMLKTGGINVRALANVDGNSVITVVAQSLAIGGPNVTFSINSTIATATLASSVLTKLNTSITNVNTKLGIMGAQSKAIGLHLTFVRKLQDSLDGGVGNLVDADMAKESAKLQSLQTKQQLGIQAVSIANQSTSSILSLFR